ncbi:Uncharacterised protein [Mycobacterium tuberculosis]|nr:Uncharacterised protein [Mycobacterium tuberculosis]
MVGVLELLDREHGGPVECARQTTASFTPLKTLNPRLTHPPVREEENP